MAGARKRRPWWGQVAFVLLFALLSWGGAVLCVGSLGRTLYNWKGFEIEMRLLPALTGQTRLQLTPFGEVMAHTHSSPVLLVARLEHIEVEELQGLVAGPVKADALAQDFKRTAQVSLRDFVIRQVVFGAIGGLLAPFLLHCRRMRAYLIGGAFGGLWVGVALGSVLLTFNGKAFENPTYTGALRYASWAMKFGQDVFVKFEELSGQLKTIAQNLHTLYGRIDAVSNTLAPDDEGDMFRVLHISDVHNNVAAFPFIREVADKFQVAFIVDTGDLTDFGSALEAGIMQGIRRLPYPYVIALGNHDSPKVGEALADVPNVTVLDGTLKTVKDVRILGIPNPAAARQGLDGINPSPEETRANQTELLQRIRALPEPPDIVAVHDPRQAHMVWGRVPLVLCGHMHQQGIEEQTAPPAGTAVPDTPTTKPALTAPAAIKTVVCNAGTTGAAGTRYFSKKTGVPFTCAVLTFRRPPKSNRTTDGKPPTGGSAAQRARPTLYAIELISLDGSLHQYSLSRRTFPAPPTTANASSSP